MIRHLCSRFERGQSLVEFAVILPFLMMLTLGSIEFGTAFNHHLTLEYATREGARAGATLVNGGGPLGCGGGQSPNADDVDPAIVASVERVLDSSGSPVDLGSISEIRIYQADAAGLPMAGKVNVWSYTPGAGPMVDGARLNFSETSVGWEACARNNIQPADSLGVSLVYRYDLQTPFLAFTGFGHLNMADRTVMALNPTNT